MEVKELKNKYGGKKGNWVPIDKGFIYYFPEERSFTELEAMLSYAVDIDNGVKKSERSYARIWRWSRTKVKKFMTEIEEPEQGHHPYQFRATSKPPVFFINKNLWNDESQNRANSEPAKSQSKATTYNPNPKSNHKDYIYAEFFEKFWSLYPKRNGVKQTKSECKAYVVQKKKVSMNDFPAVLLGIENYSINNEYPKDPIRFLKKELWKDHQQKPEQNQYWNMTTIPVGGDKTRKGDEVDYVDKYNSFVYMKSGAIYKWADSLQKYIYHSG